MTRPSPPLMLSLTAARPDPLDWPRALSVASLGWSFLPAERLRGKHAHVPTASTVGLAMPPCPGLRGAQGEDFQCKNRGSLGEPAEALGHPVSSYLLNERAFQSKNHQSHLRRPQSGSAQPKGGHLRHFRDCFILRTSHTDGRGVSQR